MSEINIVSRTQQIVVDPIISSVEVSDIQFALERQVELLAGNRLANSFPATLNTGNVTSAAPEFTVANFRLPANMGGGDHVRIRFTGSLGDMLSGGAVPSWYFRVYLNNVKVTEVYPSFAIPTGFGSTPLRAPFFEDIDIMHQTTTSAWVWHRHSQGMFRGAASVTIATDGTLHTLAAYANPAVDLADIPIKIMIQNGTAVGSNVDVRGLTVEHLISQWAS
jgi:hypothetical protein